MPQISMAVLVGCIINGMVRLRWRYRGEEEQIDRVIQSVSSGHFVSIERMDVKTIPVEEERNFRTR